jgi:protease I
VSKPNVVMFVAQDIQDEEYIYPYYRFQEDCDLQTILVVHKGNVNATCKNGNPIRYQKAITEDSNPAYPLPDLVYIPGGWAPEIMRMNPFVLDYLNICNNHEVPIAAICHGPQVLISAGIAKGYTMTGYVGIKDDIENAGARYHKGPWVRSNNVITCDHYRNQPEFMKECLRLLKNPGAQNTASMETSV